MNLSLPKASRVVGCQAHKLSILPSVHSNDSFSSVNGIVASAEEQSGVKIASVKSKQLDRLFRKLGSACGKARVD